MHNLKKSIFMMASCLSILATFSLPIASLAAQQCPDCLEMPQAHQYLSAMSSDGGVIVLGDGSKWDVAEEDRHFLLQHPVWGYTQDLIITPRYINYHRTNSAYYKYVIYNTTLNQRIAVRLRKAPILAGAQTLFITQVDRYAGAIVLSDNSVWYVDSRDQNLSTWSQGSRVMLGVNNNSRESAIYPYILINVELYGQPYSYVYNY